MNTSQIIALYDQDQRKDVEYPDMRREVTPNVVRQIDTSDIREGTISYSQLNEVNANDTICAQVSYLKSIGQNFEWKLYDYDQPSDLIPILANGNSSPNNQWLSANKPQPGSAATYSSRS